MSHLDAPMRTRWREQNEGREGAAISNNTNKQEDNMNDSTMNRSQKHAIRGLILIAFLVTTTAALLSEETRPPVKTAELTSKPIKIINFRNDGSGVYPDAEPPVDLDWSAPTNTLWKTPTGLASASDPIIVGDRIFVLGEPLRLMCLDKNTGKSLWERDRHARPDVPDEDKAFRLERYYLWWKKALEPYIGEKGINNGEGSPQRTLATMKGANSTNILSRLKTAMQDEPETWKGCDIENIFGHSSCQSPVSDGARVVAAFRTGVVVCYDLEGNRQWIHLMLNKDGNVLKDGVRSQSPILVGGKVIIFAAVGQCFGLDANTGKEVFNTPVKNPGVRNPVAARKGDIWYVCSAGGSVVRVDDGAVVLECPDVSGRSIAGDGTGGHGSLAFINATVDRAQGLFLLPGRGIVCPEKRDAAAIVTWRLDGRWLHQFAPKEGPPYQYRDFVHWIQCFSESARELKQLTEEYKKRGDKTKVPNPWDTLTVKDAKGRVMGKGTFFNDGDRSFHAEVVKDNIIYNFGSSRMSFSARDATTNELLYVHNLCSEKQFVEQSHYVAITLCFGDTAIAGKYVFVQLGDSTLVFASGPKCRYIGRKQGPRNAGTCGMNPVFEGRRVYWRSTHDLYCIGKEQDQ